MVILQVEKVAKRFGGLLAVDDVSFSLDEGEILGLIGPNGAGKTTLFNLLTGFLQPESGRIHFRGADITRLPPHAICRLGMVRTFQIVRPFLRLSVLENVVVAALLRTNAMAAARRQAEDLLTFVGLEARRHTPAATLTLPDRKRLELGRALATQPRLLMLDEVMAGLTPTESDRFLGLIRQVNQRGVTVLLIEHVMRAVMALSHRVLVLNYGELIAAGSPAAVVRDRQVIEAYLGEDYAYAGTVREGNPGPPGEPTQDHGASAPERR
ncbi:MAG: ABC transporter ATP-binding protein [Candidatus Tectomicrobia bacterium]|nr:ABC transporter ATP-binding protein [Candidatus Tectomicrobia bacterium]